ncbi:deoxynucleotidyltransferase terminal-interacting protein 2 [Asbolus verrucosus]|uniref:Deoxynucleotidyltransferase terminal-interacting protein 2 n=1 Tax=Asbolus verrucosus TaxID=1661398 RepID=A0A482W2Z4_ASBVE|nr:deoxynucleotidyltransferase terminal-interacting protein 2 [Asbolus verrucosus]
MDFVIDTVGRRYSSDENQDEPVQNRKDSLVSQLLKEYNDSLGSENSTNKNKKKKDESMVKTFLEEMGWSDKKVQNEKKNVLDDLQNSRIDVQEVLKKSVITPEFEKYHAAPPFEISEKILKKQRKKQAELTKGKKWYGLPATEMTEEVKRDLEVLQMRSVLDPKRFYKKNDLKVLPKYFQIGKVLDSPLDYYNNRLTKKERKKTLVDELLADAEFNKYNKRKYKEIIEEKQKTHYKAWRKAKKLKKKK